MPPQREDTGPQQPSAGEEPAGPLARREEPAGPLARREEPAGPLARREEPAGLQRRGNIEDNAWAIINIVITVGAASLIPVGLLEAVAHPVVGIASIATGFITVCISRIPILTSIPRHKSFERRTMLEWQQYLENLIEEERHTHPDSMLLQEAVKAYVQLGKSDC